MWLVVGLGNPGPEYAGTRHNVGFMVVDRLARDLGITVDRVFLRALVGQGQVAGQSLVLAKPLTYMNRSGEAVAALLNWYRLTPAHLLVVSDDLDLPTGRLRLRKSGGHGGHKGLRSIIELAGSREFPRLRVGIGRPAGPGHEVVDWVLGRFTEEESPLIEKAVADASKAVQVALTRGLDAAMNLFNAGRV
ncbi:PTH1 family peptidyl-tRNA hydrolase [Desulfofundulus luciae]|uniref:Peptidyl-tRNA hydrolase n=1 Tax=Desulfofundulus luciae TaxID=74702 RepID=A0ABU0AXX2_9FIRM|nr:aminoacyl-tRNA hydrolase [Desulfofundulus luciae]MDQ0285326.1 PTH1 family peptidyl-tRNA hydrolase [Desulfofundulus luciae]